MSDVLLYANYKGISIINLGLLKRPTRFGSFIGRLSLSVLSKVAKLFPKPDVILCSTRSISAGRKWGKCHGVKVGAFIRAFENFDARNDFGFQQSVKTKLFGNFGPVELKALDFLLPNSQFMEEFCLSKLGPMNTHVVYPPVDKPAHGEADLATETSKVLMIGTSAKKGINIVKELARRMPHVDFTVIGATSSIKSQFSGVANVHTHGWVENPADYIAATSVMIVPSQWDEPFGRVSIEAQLHGKIALVADAGGLPETVDFDQRYIVERTNVEEWEKKLSYLIENQAQSRPSRERIDLLSQRYSRSSITSALADFLRAQE
jgi:glycosyltransferase involved in cell wall biosynthesis